jgi:hypothetical protein
MRIMRLAGIFHKMLPYLSFCKSLRNPGSSGSGRAVASAGPPGNSIGERVTSSTPF